MEKEKLLRSVTIVGLLFGLALWLCFYSNLIFKNTEISFGIVPEIFFSLLFISLSGVMFGDITAWYIKENKFEWETICNDSLNYLLFLSFALIVCITIGIAFKEYLPKNDVLKKIAIIWIILNLWPSFIYSWSRKKMDVVS